MSRPIPWVCGAAVVATSIAATACSGSAPDVVGTHAGDSPPTSGPPPGRAEDARYAADDVRHSFRTAYGQDIDCVDFFALPAVKELARRGAPLTGIPRHHTLARSEHTPPGRVPGRDDDFAFNGAPDDSGRLRSCPQGSVPMVRNLPARGVSLPPRQAANIQPATATPLAAYPPPELTDYAHVTANFTPTLPILAGQSTFSINDPTISPAGGHSNSQLWMTAGTERLTCPPPASAGTDVEQSIEIGWKVDFNPGQAYLFMEATNDGYCTNTTDGTSEKSSPVFVPTSQYFAPGVYLPALPPGVIGGTQHEMFASIQSTSVGWTITVGIDGVVEEVGYFPIALNPFSGSFANYGQYFQLGGEVGTSDGDFAAYQMGNAAMALSGYPNNAYHRDYEVLLKTPSPPPGPVRPIVPDWATTPDLWRNTQPLHYGSSTAEPSGPGWDHWFFYGNRPVALLPLPFPFLASPTAGDRTTTTE